jgi:hypothetical protein
MGKSECAPARVRRWRFSGRQTRRGTLGLARKERSGRETRTTRGGRRGEGEWVGPDSTLSLLSTLSTPTSRPFSSSLYAAHSLQPPPPPSRQLSFTRRTLSTKKNSHPVSNYRYPATLSTPPLGQLATPSLGALCSPRTLVRSATIATQHALYPASRPVADSLTQRTLSTKNSRPVSNYRYGAHSPPQPLAQSAAHFTQRNLSERVARSFHPARPFYSPHFPRCSRSPWALRPPFTHACKSLSSTSTPPPYRSDSRGRVLRNIASPHSMALSSTSRPKCGLLHTNVAFGAAQDGGR